MVGVRRSKDKLPDPFKKPKHKNPERYGEEPAKELTPVEIVPEPDLRKSRAESFEDSIELTDHEKGVARTPIDVNVGYIEKLGRIFCTKTEVATVLGIDIRTLEARPDLQSAYKKGVERGKASLRRMQWKAAEDGNTAMLIWLGKQYLGQTEARDQRGLGNGEIRHEHTYKVVKGITAEEFQKEMERRKRERIGQEDADIPVSEIED